jgi:PAS domain S-box-containing protein
VKYLNNQFLRIKSDLGIPVPYFLTVFIICIIPTLFSFFSINILNNENQVIAFAKNIVSQASVYSRGRIFSSVWVLFSVAVGTFICLLSFINYNVKKEISTPIIGLALLCTAVMDFLYLLIATGLIDLNINIHESIYFSWFGSRFLNSLLLLIGSCFILWLQHNKKREILSANKLLIIAGISFIVLTAICVYIVINVNSLPLFLRSTDGFIDHPSEFINIALFFIWGAIIMPRIIKKDPGIFSELLLLSLIPAVFAGLHMLFSNYPFDLNFNIAQFFKFFSCIIPLLGVSLNHSRFIFKQYELNLELDQKIKEKERVQIGLKNRQNLLEYAESMTNMGSWEYHVDTKNLIWSDTLYRIFGLQPQSIHPDLSQMLTMISKEYRAGFELILQKAIRTKGSFRINYQIIKADGTKRHIQGQGQFIAEERKIIATCLDVTDLKEIINKLQQNEALLKEAESISHNGSFEWSEQKGFIFWSDELYRIHGLVPNSIKVDVGFYKTFIHHEDLKRCENIFKRAVSQRKSFGIEYRIIRPNNDIRYLYGNAKVFYDHINDSIKLVGTIQDITELKNATILLEKTESIYKAIAKNVPDAALMMFNKEGNLILFDGPIIEKLRFKNQPVIGINIKELYDDLSHLSTKKYLEKAFDGEEIQLEKEIDHRCYKMSFVPVKNIESEIFSVMLVMQDISEIKEAQQDLENKVDELNRSNQDLEQFAYVASHDLQEPLRKIKAFGDRLHDKFNESTTEEGLDYIRRMQNASERMQVLIDDLLTYSRLNREEEGFVNVSLKKQISEILEVLDYSIEQKNAKVNVKVNHEISVIPTQIRQLFQNIISNSLKFSKEGENPIINIKSEIIKGSEVDNIGLDPLKEYCSITISDNGIGFEQKFADKILLPFQRLHSRHDYKGTGIGLAVCKRIVDKHKGYINIVGELNVGTTVKVIFPVKQ